MKERLTKLKFSKLKISVILFVTKYKELITQKALKLQDNVLKAKFVLNYLGHRYTPKNLRSAFRIEVVKFVDF